MSTHKKIHNHPAIIHAADIKEICKPLKQLYGIDYFSNANLDKKHNFSGLGTNPAFTEHYLQKKYFNCDSHLSETENHLEYILQDSVKHYGETKALFNDCHEFGLNHFFTILHRERDSINAYHFATSKRDDSINELYLRLLPLLQQFISHFKEKISASKSLMKAYNVKFTIDRASAAYQSNMKQLADKIDMTNFIQSLQTKRYHLFDEQSTYITEREFQCVIWLRFGMTADEIAQKLDITERTVRAHINSIKDKLKCRTLFQLGEKIRASHISQLIDNTVSSDNSNR